MPLEAENPLFPPLLAFEIFHALKCGASAIIDKAFATGNFDTVYSKANAIATSIIAKFKD